MVSDRNDTFLPIVGDQFIVRQERQVFHFCLRNQKAVKGVVVRFAAHGTGKRAYCKDMLVRKAKGHKTGFLAARRKVRFVKGYVLGPSGMLQHDLPNGNGAVVDRIIRVKDERPRLFGERIVIIERPDCDMRVQEKIHSAPPVSISAISRLSASKSPLTVN